MSTQRPILIGVDVGNVNTKLRRYGGAWENEPSLVRMAGTRQGYSFTGEETEVRPLVYHSGPASLERTIAYLVRRDAQRAGTTEVRCSAAPNCAYTRPPTICCTSL